jgi:hypothetical protein
MPEWGCYVSDRSAAAEADLAESIVMRAYLQLPLVRRQADGCWVAPLTRSGDREVRLVESVPASREQPVLRVELFDCLTETVLKSQACDEVEDAVLAFRAMLPHATVRS